MYGYPDFLNLPMPRREKILNSEQSWLAQLAIEPGDFWNEGQFSPLTLLMVG
jgi:hypothetical protein